MAKSNLSRKRVFDPFPLWCVWGDLCPSAAAVTAAKSDRRSLRRLSKHSKEESESRNLERTADTSGHRGLTQESRRTMSVERSTTLLGTRHQVTNHTGMAHHEPRAPHHPARHPPPGHLSQVCRPSYAGTEPRRGPQIRRPDLLQIFLCTFPGDHLTSHPELLTVWISTFFNFRNF